MSSKIGLIFVLFLCVSESLAFEQGLLTFFYQTRDASYSFTFCLIVNSLHWRPGVGSMRIALPKFVLLSHSSSWRHLSDCVSAEVLLSGRNDGGVWEYLRQVFRHSGLVQVKMNQRINYG